MFCAALDVSLRSVAICIIDEDGKLQLERSVPSEVADLIRCLREFGEPIHQVGLEAGTLTQHLTYSWGVRTFSPGNPGLPPSKKACVHSTQYVYYVHYEQGSNL